MSPKIDLFALAAEGTWKSGRLIDAHNLNELTTLRYGKTPADRRAGFVGRRSVKTEDGTNQQVLHTHPRWSRNGSIKGWLPWRTLPANARFYADVGFIDGARGSDGVKFQVWEHHKVNGKEVWHRIIDVHKKYDGKLRAIEADLSHLAGQRVGIELRVDAGTSSGQDWAVWVAPRIEPKVAVVPGVALGRSLRVPLNVAGLFPRAATPRTAAATPPATHRVGIRFVPVANWEFVESFEVDVRHATTEGRDQIDTFRFEKGSPARRMSLSLPAEEDRTYYTRVRLHQHDGQRVTFGWVKRTGNQILQLGTGHRPPRQPATEQVILTIVPTLDWSDVKAASVRARFQGPGGPQEFTYALRPGAAPSNHSLEILAASHQKFETSVTYTHGDGRTTKEPWRLRRGSFVLMVPEQRSVTLRLEATGSWSSIESIDVELVPLDGVDGGEETEMLRVAVGQALERTVELDGSVSATATYRLHVHAKDGTWWITPWKQRAIDDVSTLEISPPPVPKVSLGSTVAATVVFEDFQSPPQAWYPFGTDVVEVQVTENLEAFLLNLLLGRSLGDEVEGAVEADTFGPAPTEPPTIHRVPRDQVGPDATLGAEFWTDDEQKVYLVGFEGDEALLQSVDPLAGKALRARARVIGIEAPSAEG